MLRKVEVILSDLKSLIVFLKIEFLPSWISNKYLAIFLLIPVIDTAQI